LLYQAWSFLLTICLPNRKRLLYTVFMEATQKTTQICETCLRPCAKAGKRADGLQRYRCAGCGKTYSDANVQDNLFASKQAVDDSKALLALQLLVEGNSVRSTERITGLHRDTITALLVKAGEKCKALMAERIANIPVRDVQCDEIWGFVGKKESRRVLGDKDYHFNRRRVDLHRN
jgi:transposase-like protein